MSEGENDYLQELRYPPVFNLDDPIPIRRVGFRVGDLNDGRPLIVELLEDAHDLFGLVGVEIPGGLIGQ